MKVSAVLCAAFIIALIANVETLKCEFIRNVNDDFTCKIAKQTFDKSDGIHSVVIDNVGMFTNNHDVTRVIFDETKMSHVPSEVFNWFPNLKSISFEETGLIEWKREYLKGAKNLKSLNIWANPIKEFDDNSFAEILQLETLSIWMTKVTRFSPELFFHFKNLLELDLRHNNLLDLDSNTFNSIANTICYINLSRTNIEKVPEGMFRKFNELVELDLSENFLCPIDAITTFPENLRKIYVAKSVKMTNVPSSLLVRRDSDR